ncbi:hypothetical protein PG985_003390 [Apiospora marii]|uniref:Uncharacterized protein n=1 Tax=Apiospora marii TaxID=335849 RepID=A0ABR1RVF0_9PEZI
MQFTTLFALALAAVAASAAPIQTATANATAPAVAAATSDVPHARNFHRKRQLDDLTKVACNAMCLVGGGGSNEKCHKQCGIDQE